MSSNSRRKQKMTSFKGHASWAKMTVPRDKLTVLAWHLTKKLNKAEELTIDKLLVGMAHLPGFLSSYFTSNHLAMAPESVNQVQNIYFIVLFTDTKSISKKWKKTVEEMLRSQKLCVRDLSVFFTFLIENRVQKALNKSKP